MQNIIIKLQDIIKNHYGYRSELELKPISSYQSLHRDLYSSVDHSLSIPVYEPKSQKPIAFFKIYDVDANSQQVHQRLNDLVHVTLQSYVDLIDRWDVSESLVQHLQTELYPKNIIKLHDRLKAKNLSVPLKKHSTHSEHDVPFANSEILILSPSLHALDRLAFAIHETSKNPFFIRMDHMPDQFLTSINDLTDLTNTTLYIPRIQKLSPLQQKTLETYFLMMHNKPKSLLIVCGTRSSLSKMVMTEDVSSRLLQNLHFFHVLSQGNDEAPVKFETLNQCALSILGIAHLKSADNSDQVDLKTKSYNVIPPLGDLYPTVH